MNGVSKATWRSHDMAISAAIIGALAAPHSVGAHAYWRIRVTANNGSSYVALQEVEMAATSGGSDQCSGGTAFGSSYFNSTSQYSGAFDNNTSSQEPGSWVASGGPPQSVGYQFATPVSVAELRLLCQAIADGPNRAPNSFVLEYSDNGTTYVTAKTFTGVTGWAIGTWKTFSLT